MRPTTAPSRLLTFAIVFLLAAAAAAQQTTGKPGSPDATTTIGVNDKHHMNMDYSAYEGFVVDGKVDTVLSRGKVVIEGDEYVGTKGHGRFVARELSQYLV